MSSLSNEISLDPAGLGYAGKSDQEISDLMAAPARGYLPDRISPADLLEALDFSEYGALGAADKDFIDRLLLVGGEIPMASGARIRTRLFTIFGAGNTAANLSSLQQRSRAAELGLNQVTRRDVALARKL